MMQGPILGNKISLTRIGCPFIPTIAALYCTHLAISTRYAHTLKLLELFAQTMKLLQKLKLPTSSTVNSFMANMAILI